MEPGNTGSVVSRPGIVETDVERAAQPRVATASDGGMGPPGDDPPPPARIAARCRAGSGTMR